VLVGNPKPISFLASWSQSYDFWIYMYLVG
jgi:hypothetical protein